MVTAVGNHEQVEPAASAVPPYPAAPFISAHRPAPPRLTPPRCPTCRSDRTVRYAARGYCGSCDNEWAIDGGEDFNVQAVPEQAGRSRRSRALDDWAAGRPAT